jgi:uncharacterized protein (DUF2141 family)
MNCSTLNSIDRIKLKNSVQLKSSLSFLLLSFYFFICSSSVQSNTQSITVNISNVKAKKGNLVVALYNSPTTWLSSDKQFRVLTIPADKSEITAVFSNLPLGDYAVSMYQDENANGICDKSFFGIPVEKIGFSNNIVPRLFKPTFKECCVKAPKTISIQLVML